MECGWPAGKIQRSPSLTSPMNIFAVGLHHGDTGMAIEYISPFIRSVPVHFTIAACGEAHLDAGDIL